jgi:hypothetical protein
MKKLLVLTFVAGSVMFGTVGSAAAFVPPADPANRFSCPGGDPVLGHPGSVGLQKVVPTGKSLGPWNAVFNADPITLCP